MSIFLLGNCARGVALDAPDGRARARERRNDSERRRSVAAVPGQLRAGRDRAGPEVARRHHCGRGQVAMRWPARVLEQFCVFLGRVAGNNVLTVGGRGGVYIAGGVIPRFVEFFKQSGFNRGAGAERA
jgi:hypothetical protein